MHCSVRFHDKIYYCSAFISNYVIFSVLVVTHLVQSRKTMSLNVIIRSPWLKKILKFGLFKYSKFNLNGIIPSPWLKKILKFGLFKYSKLNLNGIISSPWLIFFNRLFECSYLKLINGKIGVGKIPFPDFY